MTADTDPTPDLSKLEKIRALLDKAESTEYPEEAEALTAKAVELMERHRIDEAMLADSRPPQDRGKIIEKTVFAGAGPYVNARVRLMTNIADTHSVRVLLGNGYKGKTMYLVGYETDIELTEMLYTSLLVQATRAMDDPEAKRAKPDHVHATAFRRSFLLTFAEMIGHRLRQANRQAQSDHNSEGRSVALVLADRTTDVDEDVLRRYGRLRAARPIAAGSSRDGAVAGAAAAQKADLGTNRRVKGQASKALCA